MFEPSDQRAIVLKTELRDEFLESRLVLNAAGILTESLSQDGCWFLIVDRDQLAAALKELDAYHQENLEAASKTEVLPRTYGGAVTAVLAYATTIMAVAVLAGRSAWDMPWQEAGAMQAGIVREGAWWRTVTALTLHLDEGHLAGNLLFGALFGYLAGQALGGGVAWLAIVVAGALGNLINAYIQSPQHTSIGASTAVFGALGVLVAHAFRPRFSSAENLFKRWSPLIGGILLLAFLGVGGQQTDVLAHVTGFLAGLLMGRLGRRVPSRWLASNSIQRTAGLAAISLVVLAWWVALADR